VKFSAAAAKNFLLTAAFIQDWRLAVVQPSRTY
jgi:hypothetical protein